MTASRVLPLGPGQHLTNRVFLDDPKVSALLDLLESDGDEARVVGGAVRNALLNAPLGDIDVATTATPDIVIGRARRAHLRTIPTGLAHGTVTVVVQGTPFEVTTLREDVETDGRHAVVRFGRSFAQDAARRDFTINAMSVDRGGRIHDYTGGLGDLADGRVRFIGEAALRIREDYLRVLRFFRFSAHYATDALDAAGLAASAAAAENLARLSRERVRAELFKLFCAPRAAFVVGAMSACGVLAAVLGGRVWPERFVRLRQIEEAEAQSPDPVMALAALSVADSTDAARLRDRLRLSNEERDRLVHLAAKPPRTAVPDAEDLKTLLFSAGRGVARDTVTMWHLDSSASPDNPGWLAAAEAVAALPIPTLALSGSDVVALGVQRGPIVGRALKLLQARWIAAGFPDDPGTLQRLMREAVHEAQEAFTSPH